MIPTVSHIRCGHSRPRRSSEPPRSPRARPSCARRFGPIGKGYRRNRRRRERLGLILEFLFSLALAHRDAFIVLCKFKQPFLRRVVLSHNRRRHRGRGPLAHLLMSSVPASRLYRPAHPRPTSRRIDFEPHPISVLPPVLAPRPIRAARNAHGGTVVLNGSRISTGLRVLCLNDCLNQKRTASG
jgi:hypothetical protein